MSKTRNIPKTFHILEMMLNMNKLRVKLSFITTCLALLSGLITVIAYHIGEGSIPAAMTGIIAGTAAAGLITFILLGSYEKTISIIIDRTQRVIKADLRENIPEGNFGWGEINIVASNLRKVIKGVHKWFSLVRDHTNALTKAQVQLNTGASQVSHGSQDQAEQVQLMLQGIQELAAMSEQSATRANEVMTIARETDSTARLGRDSVEKVMQAMNEIDRKTSSLEQSSKQIGQFVQLIENIASQTNLLALNAAIEAARAGEQGRGFAVVAEEVRKLAESSARATQQITQLVSAVQKSTGESVEAVRQGLALTAETKEAFNNIALQITETVQMIEQITSTAEKQAFTTSEMVSSTQSISAVAQEAAAISQETLATIQELSVLSDKLKEVAAIWKF